MHTDYIHIILADDDEDDRLFFTDAFSELKINTKVHTYNDGVELMNYLNSLEIDILDFGGLSEDHSSSGVDFFKEGFK